MHAVAVVGERSNSKQRGRITYACGPHVETKGQYRRTPVKREAAVAALASEGLALVAGSAGAGNSAVALYLFNFIQCLEHRLRVFQTTQITRAN